MMMKWISNALVLAFVAGLLSSCGSLYYAPNAHNVPLFRQKHDAKLSASMSAGDDVNGIEYQAGYALNDHIGLVANGYHVRVKHGRGDMAELGLGYFRELQGKQLIEVYGGMAYGEVLNERSDYLEQTDFTRYYIQPAFGVSGRIFEIAFSTRFCALNYHRIDRISAVVPDDSYTNLLANRNSFLFEPACTMRIGWEYLKCQIQVGYSENITNNEFAQDPWNLNLGLYLSFSELYTKRRSRQLESER